MISRIPVPLPKRKLPIASASSEEPKKEPVEVANDLLEGAAAIARFMFGEKAHPRRAHTLIRNGLPHAKNGNRIWARRSTILEWIKKQEERSGR
jgi:hypothetical protein